MGARDLTVEDYVGDVAWKKEEAEKEMQWKKEE